MASPKPAVIVRREFEATPDVVSQQLRACIVGPSAQLVRYGQAAEKANSLVATVTSDVTDIGVTKRFSPADLTYSIPNIAYTSVLDEPYCKVYLEDAYLTWAHIAQASILNQSVHSAGNIAGGSNSLTCTASNGWKVNTVNGTSYGREGDLPQDVAVGDVVQIYTGSALAHTSTVTGFDGTVVAASQATPVNAMTTTQTLSTTPASLSGVSLGAGTYTVATGSYLSTAAHQVADPRRIGKLATVYTITVTEILSATNVSYTVTSDSGLDNLTVTNVASAHAAVALPSGATITITFTNNTLAVGNTATFTINVAHTQQLAGTAFSFAGTLSASTPTTTYIFTCTQGGSFSTVNTTADYKPKFRVSTNNGADVVSELVLDGTLTPSGALVGSYGLAVTWVTPGATVAKGFVKGDSFSIVVTGARVNHLDKLVFADPTGSSSITATYIRISKKKSIQLPKYQPNLITPNWSITNGSDADLRRLVVENLLVVRDASIGSGATDANVTAGKIYLEYRAFQALAREVGSALSLSDITTQLGTIDPDNPLAYGVYKAWSNANGATVHYIPTVSQTLNGTRGFADALALAQGNRNCYSLVPLTTSSEIWNAFAGHVQDESDPTVGRFRLLWIAPEIEQHFKSVDKDSLGNDIFSGAPVSLSGKWAISAKTAGNANSPISFTQTVQPGDFVRTGFGTDVNGNPTYVEYKIAAVIDNLTLLLNTTTNPATTGQRIEIYRDLTSSALATKYAQVAGGFSSDRVYGVVPDRGINGLRVDGVPVSNWYVACAFAGLRSGSVPQQPLSNVELAGFDGITVVDQLFDEPDLDTLRDGGIWVVRKAEDGRIYSERQLSTSTLDIYRKEQSVTTNIDSISFALADGLRDLVGRVNITEGTRGLVEATIRQILGTFTATNGAITTGPQLLSYELVSVTVPATAKDTLVVKVTVEIPLPMNIIDITLVI